MSSLYAFSIAAWIAIDIFNCLHLNTQLKRFSCLFSCAIQSRTRPSQNGSPERLNPASSKVDVRTI